jgi:hypothetical protein
VIQVHESINMASLNELAASFDWSTLKIYGLLAQGGNHGILLATCRWRPAADADAN